MSIGYRSTIAVQCCDCEAITVFDEKSIDDNKPTYNFPEYCPYCGKRSIEQQGESVKTI